MDIFSSCVAYFYQEESAATDYDVIFAQCMLIAQGGTSLEKLEDIQTSSSRLTHIFVADAEFDHDKLKQTMESFGTVKLDNIKIVRYQWILDCDAQKKRICDTNYRINV